MSSSEDSPIFPKIDVLPRENILPWKESLEAAALACCASHGPDGALGLACDAASWLARHGGNVVARPVHPDPGILAAAATPAERQAHATALVRFRDFSTAAAKLRKLALESIGDTNLDAIRDADLRLHHVTANSIIVSMDTLHGMFTEADINEFLEALNAKLKSVTAFDAHDATFNKTLAKNSFVLALLSVLSQPAERTSRLFRVSPHLRSTSTTTSRPPPLPPRARSLPLLRHCASTSRPSR